MWAEEPSFADDKRPTSAPLSLATPRVHTMATNKSSCPHKPDVASGIHSCRSYLLWCVYSESVANTVTARSGQRTFRSNRHRKRYAPSFGARRKASAKALASTNASTRTKPLGQQARQRYPQNASSTMHTVSYLPNTESLNSIAEYEVRYHKSQENRQMFDNEWHCENSRRMAYRQ